MFPASLSRRLLDWLRSPPIPDPVDRHNAPMLQIVLAILGTLPPLLWLYRIAATDIAWRPGETGNLVASLVISAMAFFSLALIRHGRFQWAIRQMLAVVAVLLLVTYAGSGLSANTYEQPLQVMWLFVAGLMVGQRALWAMFAILVAALFLGAAAETGMTGEPVQHLLIDALIRAAMFLLVAVVVDRSIAALRAGLDAAVQRGRELAAVNARLEQEIAARERTRELLLHAQKVETIGHMASGVAHDFNHLLGLILGYAARGRDSREVDTLQEVITGMESAARRASAITHKLLSFSRRDATRLVRFDARQALEDMEPMLRQALGPRTALQIQLPATPCPIVFDRAQFGLMILNLTANSAQAIEGRDQGRFGLALTRREDGAEIDIVVRDNGTGIIPEVQARMFEPFFTTKPAGQGTGLGLSIVHSLVTESGGSLQVHSMPGEGTTVRITLPLAAGGKVDERPAPGMRTAAPGGYPART